MTDGAGEQVFGGRLDHVLADRIVAHSQDSAREKSSQSPFQGKRRVSRGRAALAGAAAGYILYLFLSRLWRFIQSRL